MDSRFNDPMQCDNNNNSQQPRASSPKLSTTLIEGTLSSFKPIPLLSTSLPNLLPNPFENDDQDEDEIAVSLKNSQELSKPKKPLHTAVPLTQFIGATPRHRSLENFASMKSRQDEERIKRLEALRNSGNSCIPAVSNVSFTRVNNQASKEKETASVSAFRLNQSQE